MPSARAASLALALCLGCSEFRPVETDFVGSGIHGCTDDRFVDRSADGAMRVVAFGGTMGSGSTAYDPPCLTIAAGQSVTFAGNFTFHPLRPGESRGLALGSANNPIPPTSSGDATVDVSFPTAGTYPYFCQVHAAIGMRGVVRVVAR